MFNVFTKQNLTCSADHTMIKIYSEYSKYVLLLSFGKVMEVLLFLCITSMYKLYFVLFAIKVRE